ncbi:MAG: CBS domain-containing protein [Planctomycetes bacterium]|nr:CBS domain-containing protein [Planctomycetota bacterium]
MQKIVARDLMCREISTVPVEMPIGELAEFLSEERIHGAPVVDRSGELVGVVSRSDVIRTVGEESEHPVDDASSLWALALQQLDEDLRVRDIMTADPITACPEATAGEIAKLMLAEGIHRILVIEGGSVIGIVSATDLLGAIPQYEAFVTANT